MNSVVSIPCPHCGAEVGYKCFTESGRTMRNQYHVERTSKIIRIEAAKKGSVGNGR